jgi:pimeloyl-ACP methyl ester carboxylesterase
MTASAQTTHPALHPTANTVEITLAQRRFDIEYAWVGVDAAANPGAPLLVFLHEGLGSVAMWRDYPAQLCTAGGFCGLVLSRSGYGASTPRSTHERWPMDQLRIQAHAHLPAVFAALGINTQQREPWLFGHSDGGSIALLYAAQYPDDVAGIIVLAPHIVIESLSLDSIRSAKSSYQTTALRERLGKFHTDVDSAFYGWNDMWLDPAFTVCDLHQHLHPISCPVLAIQGEDDIYGTMAQIDGIKRAVAHTQLLKLPDCGHSPHREQAQATTAATVAFIQGFVQQAV